jgi:hypothetical protein
MNTELELFKMGFQSQEIDELLLLARQMCVDPVSLGTFIMNERFKHMMSNLSVTQQKMSQLIKGTLGPRHGDDQGVDHWRRRRVE